MTIKTYIKKLQKLADKHPKAKVIYAIDEEGNSFKPVIYTPSVGAFVDFEFIDECEFKEEASRLKVNAVCIN
jgi:hypothetical protein